MRVGIARHLEITSYSTLKSSQDIFDFKICKSKVRKYKSQITACKFKIIIMIKKKSKIKIRKSEEKFCMSKDIIEVRGHEHILRYRMSALVIGYLRK